MKIHLCKTCGETDPLKFNKSSKGTCSRCQNEKNKESYRQKTGGKPRKFKPFLCEDCGETNPELFRNGNKSRCINCQNINKKTIRLKSIKPLPSKQLLSRLNRRNVAIKKLIETINNDGSKMIWYTQVLIKNSNNEIIRTYDNTIQAAVDLNCSRGKIEKYCRKGILLPDGMHMEYGEKKLAKQIIDTRTKVGTQEYFKETVIANHGDIYLFDRARYAGTDKYVEIGCKKHNHYFTVKAATLLRRTERNGGVKKNPEVGSCPICREEYFAGIKDDMISKCRQAHNNEYEYGEYVNMETPLVVICKIHGEFEVMPSNHSQGGNRCPECYPIIPRSPEIKYVGEQKYYLCEIHGEVPIGNSRTPSQGCPTCVAIENERSREENLRKYLDEKFGAEYDIFITKNFVEFRCKKHGTRTTYTRAELREKKKLSHHCDDCRAEAEIQRLKEIRAETNVRCKEMLLTEYNNQYEFIEFMDEDVNINKARVKILNLLNNEEKIVRVDTVLKKMLSKDTRYLLRSYLSYDEAKERVKLLGITDFRQYKKWYVRTQQTDLPTNPQRHYVGKGWVNYNDFFGNDEKDQMSVGERRITDYLLRKNIKYEYQKRYEDCRNINPLPFDFYLPEYNLIVEFDGYQHFNPVKKWGGAIGLKQRELHDSIKNKYCKDNGINIIRITYLELEDNVVEWTLDNEITRVAAERHFANP